ncbi:MAG: MFS transporter [Planctomycetes bacterium]|nr:MFS transporter [Planctomycetota bacterium]
MRRILNITRSDDVPLMSRPNFIIERRHLMAWGMFSGIVEGNISTIVVLKTFHASEFLATTVWSIPFVANMLMVLWAGQPRSQPKLKRLITLGLCAVVSMASIFVTPSEYAWGGWLFAAQLLATRLFLAGVVAVRTTIWNANYPKEQRARLVARLQALRFLMGLMIAAVVTRLFDLHPQVYRFVYPSIACVGLFALLLARPLRVRGESRAAARNGDRDSAPATGFMQSMRNAAGVLRDDRRFARYCTAQFFLGSANFMIEPVLTITLIQQLGFGYFWTAGIMDIIPAFVMLLAMQFWAPHFDRVGAVQFRVVNSAVWVVAFAMAALSMLMVVRAESAWTPLWIGAIAVLLLARVMAGIGRGGGAIAWHIGHLHFARPDNAETYMRVHMALTGLRGILLPQFSRMLNQRIGSWSFVIAVLSGVIGMLLYRRLARDDRRQATAAEAEAERSTPQTVRADVT